jgi:hypothetical protein
LQTQVSQCFCSNLGWQWDVTVFHYNFLTLFRQNQFHELGFQRSQRLVRGFVDVNVEEARQRIFAVQGVLFGVFDEVLLPFLARATVFTLAVL